MELTTTKEDMLVIKCMSSMLENAYSKLLACKEPDEKAIWNGHIKIIRKSLNEFKKEFIHF